MVSESIVEPFSDICALAIDMNEVELNDAVKMFKESDDVWFCRVDMSCS